MLRFILVLVVVLAWVGVRTVNTYVAHVDGRMAQLERECGK